jgi:hypothetical protein
LEGASTGFGYKAIDFGYGSYGNTSSFQHVSVILIQEYVCKLESLFPPLLSSRSELLADAPGNIFCRMDHFKHSSYLWSHSGEIKDFIKLILTIHIKVVQC